MTNAVEHNNAINTWNFLRLSIVGLVAGLGVAVAWELDLAPQHCLEQSISAYFFTPARGVFTGALIGIGVALLCLRGSTAAENWFLNLAGVFAPLVALIPTPSGGDTSCASYPATAAGRVEGYTNAMVAVLAISAVFIVAAAIRVLTHNAHHPVRSRWQLSGAVALWIVLMYLFAEQRDFFDKYVHFTSAILMFVCAAIVIILNATDNRRPGPGLFTTVYLVCFGAMALAAIIILIVHFAGDWQNHWVFWFEFAEIVPFTLFWATQTWHLWNKPERPLFVE